MLYSYYYRYRNIASSALEARMIVQYVVCDQFYVIMLY